jgi:Uma2 family endonuclease
MDTIKPAPVIYPDTDGLPMTESDATRDYLLYCVEVLRLYFQSRRRVYVSGNLFIYYQEGQPRVSISPDVFVIFGVNPRKRRSYKAWEENGRLPDFILEITSFSTRRQDQVEKPQLYASLGVKEYFQYDPTADYLNPQLQGAELVDGQYQPLPLQTDSSQVSYIHSQVLGLDLQLQTPAPAEINAPRELRFYDPQTRIKLLSRDEVEQQLDTVQQERNTAQLERDAAQLERDNAQLERDAAVQKAASLAARLRALGLDPDADE